LLRSKDFFTGENQLPCHPSCRAIFYFFLTAWIFSAADFYFLDWVEEFIFARSADFFRGGAAGFIFCGDGLTTASPSDYFLDRSHGAQKNYCTSNTSLSLSFAT
jgi:hypothetical protein